jgi:Flp pilus assembly protein TadG
MIKKLIRSQKNSKKNAQAIIEFALILPFLLALLIGILEFGRLVFIYAAVTNASREAVRFGSAIGFEDNTYYRKYQYCSAIREVAKVSSFLVDLQDSNIVIEYDNGPGSPIFDTCPVGVVRDTTIVVNTGQDRVKVTVSANYSPLTKLLPISSQTITSSSSRTILGYAQVGP